jgi:hypothetical protein
VVVAVEILTGTDVSHWLRVVTPELPPRTIAVPPEAVTAEGTAPRLYWIVADPEVYAEK